MDLLSTSGIDSLISNFRYYERSRRITPLEQRKTKISNLSSAWSDLNTKLTSLRSELDGLKSTEGNSVFDSKIAELSNSDYFTATATSSAVIGAYTMTVDQLAQFDNVVSDTKTSDSASNVQAGTLSFRVQSGTFDSTIEITTTGSETYKELMEKISTAINEAGNGSIAASAFSPITGQSKLSIAAQNSGKDNEITLSDVSGNALASIGLNLSSRVAAGADGSAGYVYAESELNSKLTFNGISVERNSNTIDDLISGVTLILKEKMDTGVPRVNIMIKNDTEKVKEKVKSFISSFNTAYNYLKDNYNSTKDKRAIFTGNSTASNLKQLLTSQTTSQVEGLPSGDLSFLSDIGISFDPNTGLTLSDESKLDDAASATPDQVQALFNSTNGIATKLFNTTDNYTKTDGIISHITDSFDSTVSYLSDKITSRNENIDKQAAVQRKKYEQLQVQLATLMNNYNYFQQIAQGTF